jgi:hypothetical protein
MATPVPTALILEPEHRADAEFQAALADWHRQIEERVENGVVDLSGMPEGMSPEIVRVVSHTQAIVALSPTKPKREHYCRKYGI